MEFGSSRRYGPADQYFEFKAVERLVGRPVDLVEVKAMADSRLKRVIERTQVPGCRDFWLADHWRLI